MLVLLIPYFKPICFQYYSDLQLLEELFIIWKVLAAIICCFFFIIYMWEMAHIPKLLVFIVLFETSIMMSTILNKGNISRALIDAVSIIAYSVLITLCIKYNSRGFLQVLSNLLGILVLINLCSILLYPNGLPADLYTNQENPVYFMTIDNGTSLFVAFSIMIFVIKDLSFFGTLTLKGVIKVICTVVSAFLTKSATAILVVLLICIALIVIALTDYSKYQSAIVLSIVYVGCLIYLFTMQSNIVAEFVLEKILNRSSNFTGRYHLWKSAINMIKEKFWMGYGRSAHDYIAAWGGYFSSHNYILETLLQGGVIALSLFVATVVYALRKSAYSRNTRITACIVCTLFAILIGALMESDVHSVYIFGCVSICAGSWYIEHRQEKLRR